MAGGVREPVALELRFPGGSERLDITRDGPFAFATRLARGASYTVTLVGEPPCQLDGATGVLTNAALGRACNDAATLADLGISGPTAPDLALLPAQLAYTAEVSLLLQHVSLTPVAAKVDATITVAGQPVASGTASAPLPLALGDNQVEVSHASGLQRTYRVTVRRAPIRPCPAPRARRARACFSRCNARHVIVSLHVMTHAQPRWPEGSTARMVHALAVWLAFLASVHLARLVLFPTFGLWGGVIAFALVYGGIIGLLLMRVGGVGARDLGITLRNWPTEVMLGLAGFLGISVLLLGWVLVLGGTDTVTGLLHKIANISLTDRAKFLVIGLLAASAEDTLFRGYLQPTLMARLGAITGLLLTIALFAVHHFTDWPTVSRLGSLFITGLGFGVLRWQRRPLIASYTAHTVLWLVWGTT